MTKQQIYKSFLPSHSCSCGKKFTLPGSLTNHIKKFQSKNSDDVHKKIDRGVPEGRTRKLLRYQINRLLRIFKKQAKNQGSNQNENAENDISELEGVKIFSLVKEYIDKLTEHEDKDLKLELQKENIRFQQMWEYLHKDEIEKCTYVYIRSVFYHLAQERGIKINKNVIEDYPQKQIQSNIEWQIMQMLNDCRKEEILQMKVKQEYSSMWQEEEKEEEYQTENHALVKEYDSKDNQSQREQETLKIKQEEIQEDSTEDSFNDSNNNNNSETNTHDSELKRRFKSKNEIDLIQQQKLSFQMKVEFEAQIQSH